MVAVKEKRAWLAENGHPEIGNGRGQLSAALLAEYDAAHPPVGSDDYSPGAQPGDFVAADSTDDLDPVAFGGAAFGADDYPGDPGGAPPPAGGEPGAPVDEDRPGRPQRGGGWRLPWQRPAGARAPRPPRAPRAKSPRRRVSVAPLIEDTYADLAWAARGIPPLQRMLYSQAPVAGVILDPVAKDTVIDRIMLQPMARNYDRMKVVMALVGAPASLMAVLVSAPQPVIEDGQVAWEAVIGDDGQPLTDDGGPVLRPRMTAATPQHMAAMISLRYCIRAMADLSGDAIRRVQQRAASNAERDDLVDTYMAFILGGEAPTTADETAKTAGAAEGLRLAGVAQ
jgi:hypothetical protein